MEERRRINRRDWMLALVILAAACIMLLVFHFMRSPEGNCVEIRVNGSLYSTYPLGQDEIIDVSTAYGSNRVQIREGVVTVTEADCPGHDCMRQGSISRRNETIVCLPHKLVIEITNRADGTETGPDGGFDVVAG